MNNTEILPGGTLFFTSDSYPVTTDSSLLARFAAGDLAGGGLRPGGSVCDLGSGNGMLLLFLVDAGLYGRAVGVELGPEGAGLLRAAVEVGELINVTAVQADLRDYQSPLPFDVVITNPPYFSAGPLPAGAARAMARHQVSATLDDVLAAAARLLKAEGRLYLCWPAAQRQALLDALAPHGFAPWRLQPVRAEGKTEPWLLLLDARKGAADSRGGNDAGACEKSDAGAFETLPELVITPAGAGQAAGEARDETGQ